MMTPFDHEADRCRYSMMGPLTPFDHWWKLYPGFRKNDKEKCRNKFNQLDLETQRELYRHVSACIDRHPDWQDHKYICAPLVYLNQERWQTPIPEAVKVQGRPTSIAITDPLPHRITSLEKLIRLMKVSDRSGEVHLLEQQLERLYAERDNR